MPISSIQNNLPISTSVDTTDKEAIDFKKGIDAWVSEYAPGEYRSIAGQRIMEAYFHKKIGLNLEGLNLTTLPTQLGKLVHLLELNLSKNQLTNISVLFSLVHLLHLKLDRNRITNIIALSNLTELHSLNLAHNSLTKISDLSRLTNLTSLNLFDNQITDIRVLSNLRRLRNLDLSDNQITDVTGLSNLTALSWLFLQRNQLTSLPYSFLRLSSKCDIYLDNNRFSEAVIGQLDTIVNAGGYTGPRISFSMASVSDQEYKARSLVDVVASWYQRTTLNTFSISSKAVWQAIDNEASAKDFSVFLQRLYNTVNATRPAFKAKVLDWLKRLERDKELRHEIFFEAKEGLGSCEDRISLTFNAMKQRELTLNVERGYYDRKLDELISLARQAFRFNELAKMAYEKVQRLKFVGEVEVYLAYLVKSHKDLNLDIDTPEMCSFGVSHVTDHDVQTAVLCVKQSENTQFLSYLANDWTPWLAVLRRLLPEAYKKLDATIYTEKERAFANRQAVFAANRSVTDINYLQMTRDELDEIAASCKREFTQAFLQKKGLSALLNPVW